MIDTFRIIVLFEQQAKQMALIDMLCRMQKTRKIAE